MGGNRGGGIDGEDGEVDGPDFVHLEIRRYLEQSRPLLVGHGADAGYFFTAEGGQPLSLHWINSDLKIMLGYEFYGARDLFTACGHHHGMSAEDAGLKLHVTPQTVVNARKRLLGEKTRKANRTVKSQLQSPMD